MKTDLKSIRNFTISTEVNGKVNKTPVEGYRVCFAGFEEYTFFVHHRSDGLGDGWRISEESVGFAFPSSYFGATRQVAIDKSAKVSIPSQPVV